MLSAGVASFQEIGIFIIFFTFLPFVGNLILKSFQLLLSLRSIKEVSKIHIMKDYIFALFWEIPGLNIIR